jgi:glyoxylate/hydroxypyruvate reductase A
MHVLLAVPPGETARWRGAFARALPEARIDCWPDAPTAVDYALVWKPPEALFRAVRVRRAIVNLGAGVDRLLALAPLPPDVPILRLEDAGMAEQMAEYVALAVLAAFREQRAYALAQQRRDWAPRARLDKRTYAVGLLGVGVLGRAVAAALAPFGFPLVGWTRTPQPVPGMAMFAGMEQLPSVLAQARVLVCMLPSTPATRHLLDRSRLAQLPAGAHLVNVARGDLVVEADLLALLDAGHLASATLDVFEQEPLPAAHRFWHHPGVTLTPHVSAATLTAETVAQVAARLRALDRGDAVPGIVDRQRGY